MSCGYSVPRQRPTGLTVSTSHAVERGTARAIRGTPLRCVGRPGAWWQRCGHKHSWCTGVVCGVCHHAHASVVSHDSKRLKHCAPLATSAQVALVALDNVRTSQIAVAVVRHDGYEHGDASPTVPHPLAAAVPQYVLTLVLLAVSHPSLRPLPHCASARTSAAVMGNADLAAVYPLITSPPLGCRICPAM